MTNKFSFKSEIQANTSVQVSLKVLNFISFELGCQWPTLTYNLNHPLKPMVEMDNKDISVDCDEEINLVIFG